MVAATRSGSTELSSWKLVGVVISISPSSRSWKTCPLTPSLL